MENWHLIVGLGNPGRQYAHTRHNVGFMVLQELADRWKTDWRREKRFRARMARAEREGHRVLLCLPETFMNASGEAVQAITGYYRIAPSQVWVIVDDADLPLGEIRLRAQGSSGGHHGLESVEQHLATRSFPRLRVGIGRAGAESREITEHVLSRFGPAESKLCDRIVVRACEQIECWLRAGIGPAMNEFNGVITN